MSFFKEENIDNNYETIEFLGDKVVVPNGYDIHDYLRLIKTVEESQCELEKMIKSQVDECKSQGDSAWAKIVSHFYNDIYDYEDNGAFINELIEKMRHEGIFVAPNNNDEKYWKDTKSYALLIELVVLQIKRYSILHFI